MGRRIRLTIRFWFWRRKNPIEHEGTYPLPEAQVDRFMLKIKVNYPSHAEELQILRRMTTEAISTIQPIISPEDILRFREVVRNIYMAEQLENYIVDLVCATRAPAAYQLDELSTLIEYGASPRATIFSGVCCAGAGIPLATWLCYA